ncbi:hypothetical protein GGI07_005917, partial [Coemansia sp. Benny D115]
MSRANAETVATAVAASLEDCIEGRSSPSTSSAQNNTISTSGGATDQLSASLDEMWPLVKDKHTFTKEADMYPCIQGFFQFVKSRIAEEANSRDFHLRHTLEVYDKADTKPIGAADSNRIDLALYCPELHQDTMLGANISGVLYKKDKLDATNYRNMLAIIKAKKYTSDQSTAYGQLLLYTRNLYVCQFDRRFSWGFTVCNSIVHMCIIANDKVYPSDDIDLRKSGGRSKLVMLLCNMSFCKVDQLGYDLSISYNKIADRWETTVFDDDEIADDELADSSMAYDDDDVSEELVIIKDAWAFVPKTPEGIAYDDPRNEVQIMRKITNALSDNQNFAGMYPTLEHGGVVWFADTDGEYTIKDNEEHVVGRLGENAISEYHICVHKRLAMKPIGEPLYSARSVYELIIVVADAMLVYMVIWKKAKILHRDISDNNILLIREDSWIRGMLIDFDNSLDISDPEVLKRVIQPGMMGTLPFMSIPNLENHQGGYYTVLDDW